MVTKRNPPRRRGLGIWIAFAAGLASFLSPCVVPLVPSYLSALAGTAFGEPHARPRVVGHALAFVAGLAAVMVASGLAATALGAFIGTHTRLLAELGGIVMAVLGLELAGLIHVGLLSRAATLRGPRRAGVLGAGLLGVVFAFGWTPCVGPIWASILVLAARTRSEGAGALLLTAYAAGLAVPFLALALGLDRVLLSLRRIGPWLPWVSRVAGGLLVLLGAALFTGFYTTLPGLL
jgi:cytochrome c-type biogenesis protein